MKATKRDEERTKLHVKDENGGRQAFGVRDKHGHGRRRKDARDAGVMTYGNRRKRET